MVVCRHGDEVRKVVRGLVLEGLTRREVAALSGVAPSTVLIWMTSWGMSFRRSSIGGAVGVEPRGRLPRVVRPHSRVEWVQGCGHGRRLTLGARFLIEEDLKEGLGVREIAEHVGVAPSTVSREIARASRAHTLAYSAREGQRLAGEARRRPSLGKLEDPDLRAYVVAGLDAHWSPEQISHRIVVDHPHQEAMRVSHETIYQALYVQGEGSLRQELKKERALRSGRKKRIPRSPLGARPGRGAKTWVQGANISTRPPDVEDRAVPGHWEGDLIVGAGSQSAAITLVERTHRFTLIRPLPLDHSSPTVIAELKDMISSLPHQLARSLTWDQGSELAQVADLRLATHIDVYFCDPHSPWQRGSNENTNGLLREFLPKGCDLSTYSEEYFQEVQDLLNDRPRETLGWKTPIEALKEFMNTGVALTP